MPHRRTAHTDKPLSRSVKDFFADAKTFIREELWTQDVSGLPRVKRFVFSMCRVSTIVIKGFITDNCALQSSALTYITLMSMVPVLALMLSVSKGLGAQHRLMQTAGLEYMAESGEIVVTEGGPLSDFPEQMTQIVCHLFEAVERTNFATLGTAGLLLVLWSVMKAMGKVEKSFNLIWGIKQSRTLFRKFTDYVSILIVVPILMLMATSINTMLSSEKMLTSLQQFSGHLYWVYVRSLRLSGLGFILIAFVLVYMFMPNTKVRLFPALVAGVVGGLCWYFAQRLYIELQVGVTKNNAIYGTFAAIPFFLAWLYLNWTIVLFGAEVGFAMQNHRTYAMERAAENVSSAAKMTLALVVTYEACKAFLEGKEPWSADEFGTRNGVPARLLADVTFVLSRNHVLVPVADRHACHVPGRDTGKLTLADVEGAFRGGEDSMLGSLPARTAAEVRKTFRELYSTFKNELDQVSFRELIERDRACSVPENSPVTT